MQAVIDFDLNKALAERNADMLIETVQSNWGLRSKVAFLNGGDNSKALSDNVLTRYNKGAHGEVIVSTVVYSAHLLNTRTRSESFVVTVTVTSKYGEPSTVTRTLTRTVAVDY